MPWSEEELSTTLREGAKHILDCVKGCISFETFLVEYDSFYMKYALDGHESDDEEIALFQNHEAEISVHEEVWDQILTNLTDDKFMNRQDVIDKEFIGHAEGFARLKKIAQKYSQVIMDSLV